DHLVAGVQRRHERVVEHLLAAGADGDLVDTVVEVVLALELADDRRLQFRNAVDGGVLGLAVADRLDRGFLDVVRGVEIGLAGAEADHVAAGRFQLARLVGDGDRGRRLDAAERVGKEGHGGSVGQNGADPSGGAAAMQARLSSLDPPDAALPRQPSPRWTAGCDRRLLSRLALRAREGAPAFLLNPRARRDTCARPWSHAAAPRRVATVTDGAERIVWSTTQ